MRKIQHGFIAIVILGGPASIILAHQKLTEALPHVAASPFDIAMIVQEAYSACSDASQRTRPDQCNTYIRSFDRCAARKNECDPRSVYEVFLKLDFSPAQLKSQESTNPL
jgi:hypothetical protein